MNLKTNMRILEEGGPVFPHLDSDGMTAEGWAGMSIRDYYAGKAMAGLLANPGGPFQRCDISGWTMVNCDHAHIAAECYRMADAMLEARKR